MRISYSDEEDYPGQFELWQANCNRSLAGKKGQVALRELERALLALPEKRLIANKLQDSDGEVCALGALAKYKGHEIASPVAADEDDWWTEDDDDMEDFGVELGLPRMVAWRVVVLNDIEIDGHYVDAQGPANKYRLRPSAFIAVTPEERYEKVLAWVRARVRQD